MRLTKNEIEKIEAASLGEGLEIINNLFPGKAVFSSSLGQEDQVITDAIFKNDLPIKIFTLDTGRLFNETYELLEKTMARYKKPIEIFFPDTKDVEEFVAKKGVNSFYESVENRKECCHIRKVKSLNRALQGAEVWITGLRAEQTDNRKDMAMIEWLEDKQLYKFNPLINWTYAEVLDYIKEFYVPYNPLHDKGFISIGCAPCTRAIEPSEDPRAGRWWWETSQKECGLHVQAPETVK
ncbi:MAG TPA: phosphoadenylyl-sulfate reductase [Chitinophagaceae bacterium]|jgi:phosphoadenosine phosphosulfate reductase|nr:phosphoadenylyl-sulfate reductase [Chitinophagaceae bacterium]